MRLILLLISNCFFVLSAASQEKVFEYDLSREKDIKAIAPTIQAGNPSVYSHVLLITKTKLKHLYVNTSGQQKEIIPHTNEENEGDSLFEDEKPDKNIINLYRNSSYLLHVSLPEKVTDVLYRGPSMKYYFVSTDTRTGALTITDTLKSKFMSELVGCLYSHDEIVLIQHTIGKNEFIISAKRGEQKIKSDTLKIDFPGKKKTPLIGKFIQNESKRVNTLIPATNLWLPPYLLDYNNLAFLNDNKLILLLNDKELNTWLITIDLNQRNYVIKQFTSPGRPDEKIKDNITSWITDSTLVRGYASADSLHLIFYNINDSRLINSLNITKDNFTKITRWPVIKSGDFWSKSNIRETDFSDFLKRCKANKLLITGYEYKNDLFLTLATKYDLLTATFLGNILTLGMLDFVQVRPPSMLSFDCSFNPGQMKFNTGETKSFVWEKILMFLWGNRTYLQSANIYFKEDYYYISYYNFDAKKIFVHRFYKYL